MNLLLTAFLFSASVEPFTIKNLALGTPKEKMEELVYSGTAMCEQKYCIWPTITYANKPAAMIVNIIENRACMVTVTFDHDNASAISDSMLAKFGSPSTQKNTR